MIKKTIKICIVLLTFMMQIPLASYAEQSIPDNDVGLARYIKLCGYIQEGHGWKEKYGCLLIVSAFS